MGCCWNFTTILGHWIESDAALLTVSFGVSKEGAVDISIDVPRAERGDRHEDTHPYSDEPHFNVWLDEEFIGRRRGFE